MTIADQEQGWAANQRIPILDNLDLKLIFSVYRLKSPS